MSTDSAISTTIHIAIGENGNFDTTFTHKGYIGPLSTTDTINLEGVLHKILSVRVEKNLYPSGTIDTIGINIYYRLEKI